MKTIKNKLSLDVVLFIAFLMMLASQYLLIFDSARPRKIFYTAGYVAILAMFICYKRINKPLKNLVPMLASLLLAGTILIWVALFKNNGAYWDIYNSYETSGKIILLFSVLIFIFSNFNIKHNPVLLDSIFIIGGILANVYAIHQYNFHSEQRIELGFDRATMAAYIITVIDILMLHAVLNRHGWVRYVLFAFTIGLTFSAIIFTGTRAAILSYPILCLLLAFTHSNVNKQHLIKMIVFFTCLLAAAVYIFQQPLEKRLHALQHDIKTLQNSNNSRTSVGARVAMFEVGVNTGSAAPLGQSAEQRNARIKQLATKDTSLGGSVTYMNVHLHNELIDNYSLRGIAGAGALILFYLSLLLCAWQNRNPTLMVITLSLMVYGLSDVIFFSREGSIVYAIGLLTAMIFLGKKEELSVQADTLRAAK